MDATSLYKENPKLYFQIKAREYRQKHINDPDFKKKKKESDAKSYLKNKASRSASAKMRYIEKRDERLQKVRAYRLKNKDEINEKRRGDPKLALKSREWRERHPEVRVKNYKKLRVVYDRMKKSFSPGICADPDCGNYLSWYQVKLGTKFCCGSCVTRHVNRTSRRFNLPGAICANPECGRTLPRHIEISKRRYCCKQCSAVHSNGHVQYNKKACLWFADFDKKYQTIGMYATNGGEKFIKNQHTQRSGFWLDYFNPEFKLIIEWDEKNHFRKNGKLRFRDKQRQLYIQDQLPGFMFLRIKDGTEKAINS